jgi:DNA-binding ferritin-like protein
MAQIMKEHHALEQLLGQGFRTMDDEKAERIRQILNSAYQEIEAILEE